MFKDASYNFNNDGGDANNTLTFNVDSTAPTVSSISPTHASIDVNANANIEITFNEAVKAGTGDITINKMGSLPITIPVNSSQVSFLGNKVVINPIQNLDYPATYTVSIANGAIQDIAGNNFNTNTFDYSFTTASAGLMSGYLSEVLGDLKQDYASLKSVLHNANDWEVSGIETEALNAASPIVTGITLTNIAGDEIRLWGTLTSTISQRYMLKCKNLAVHCIMTPDNWFLFLRVSCLYSFSALLKGQ
jgi:hypothetical protein